MALNGDAAFKRAVHRNVRISRWLGRRGELKRRKDIDVFVWTVDDWREMSWLVSSGVDGVITNRPALLTAVRAAHMRNLVMKRLQLLKPVK